MPTLGRVILVETPDSTQPVEAQIAGVSAEQHPQLIEAHDLTVLTYVSDIVRTARTVDGNIGYIMEIGPTVSAQDAADLLAAVR
jgi:hypothetical protein